ncbi:cardiolipin synthase [Maribacter sp. TH_r10]|uniref:Cardiolipin synthase n=1 Tax=Maribacter luteus TaxID=2594478 RepID=A0A6I2MQD2_9FLAO|nr:MULTISPECIES: cardiolipin synthase [Maribacter]MDV7138525.1 cardiolipin synthase [Maribacter sp. TH_r10]MRX66103.1 cardiolipin synthase [Maribacter luteus]
MFSFLKENLWSILLGVNYVLVVLFSLLIVLKNKNPVKTLSFLFILAILPFFGIFIYYFFGQDYRKHKIFEKKYIFDNESLKRWSEKFGLNRVERFDFKKEYGDGAYKIYNLLRNNGKAVLTYENEVSILVNGEQKFERLKIDLENAEDHIHMEYFVFKDDEQGIKIIELLCKKAEQGVRVKLLYDDVGSAISSKSKKVMTNSGVLHHAFLPVLFSNSTSKINYRNHRKIVVIDGKIGYLGGINIDQKYNNDYSNIRYWRDTHLRIQGAAVGALQSSFFLSWNFTAKDDIELEEKHFPNSRPIAQDPVAVQIVASGPDTDWENIMEAMFTAINTAKKRIYITTPYLIPNSQILTALTTASRSGVDVRIIIPKKSDSWAAQYATDSYIEQLARSGIRIFRYHKGFVHAKTMIIDDYFSSIGTANLDYRSFSLNFEINALIYNTRINQQMGEIFLNDLLDTEEVDYERWIERGLTRKIQESISRLWAPLL